MYAYFAGKGTVDAAKLASANALIDSVLGEGYTARVPATLAGTEAKQSTEGLTEATVYLGSEIAFAFKVAEGVSDVKFFSNGTELFSEVRGEYVYVTTYAYGITSDISYTATKGGVQIGGTYNLKSYYDYAVSLEGGESALADLLMALWSYSESAAAYRNAVNGN